MTGVAAAYAAETVLLAARDDLDQLPATEPTTHPATAWDDLPVIPSGLPDVEPF